MEIEYDSFPAGIRETCDVFKERIKTFPMGFLLLNNGDSGIIGYICSELWQIDGCVKPEFFLLGHCIAKAHKFNGNFLYISSIGIFKHYRGQGYGRTLLCRLLLQLQEFPNITSVILIVGETWHSARNIYDSEGFKGVFTINRFFNPINLPSFDGIVMVKSFRS
jgi:ribosomal protein S18 acetylase RimI-like enzyme